MKIKSWLEDQNFYSSVEAFQFASNRRLKQLLEDLPGEDWKLFYRLCCLEVEGGNPNESWHPDRVIGVAVKYAGADELEELQTWLTQAVAFGIHEILDAVARPLILDPAPVVFTREQIEGFILSTPELSSADYELWDSEYLVHTKAQCGHILKASPSHRYKFISEKRDCDEFMRIVRGWTAEQGMGNLTVGACIFTGYDAQGQQAMCHAVNIFIYRNEDGSLGAMLGEPQSDDKLWLLGEPEPGFEAKMVTSKINDFIF